MANKEFTTKYPYTDLSMADLQRSKNKPTFQQLASGEHLIQCPYEPTHIVTNDRFSGHLLKCRHNYEYNKETKGEIPHKKHCSFNPYHLYFEPELAYHESKCPDRFLPLRPSSGPSVLARASTSGSFSPFNRQPLPSAPRALTEAEDWGKEQKDEPVRNFDRSQRITPINCPPYYCPQGLTKSKRREFRILRQIADGYADEIVGKYGKPIDLSRYTAAFSFVPTKKFYGPSSPSQEPATGRDSVDQGYNASSSLAANGMIVAPENGAKKIYGGNVMNGFNGLKLTDERREIAEIHEKDEDEEEDAGADSNGEGLIFEDC